MKNSIFTIKIIIVLFLFCIMSFFPYAPSYGFDLPRYASLRDDKVNLRAGPGVRYPIKWELTRKHMPVKIIRDFEMWRQIELFDGDTTGWVHKSLLSSRRTAVVMMDEQKVYKKRKGNSRVILKLEQGVVVKIDHCSKGWCSVEISGHKGWVQTSGIWGDKKSDE